MNIIKETLRTGLLNNLYKVNNFQSISSRLCTTSALQEATKINPNVSAPIADPDKLYSQLDIELRGNEPAVLKSYTWFSTQAANHLGIEIGKCWSSRKPNKHRMTLLKSVHIFKKHRVQYEIRTHFHFLTFHKLTGSTLDTFLEYIERNLPEGVALKATKTELQAMPEHLEQPPTLEGK